MAWTSGALIGAMFFFLVVPWIFILLAPFMGLAGGAAIGVGSLWYSTQRLWERMRVYDRIRDVVTAHFRALPGAVVACACTREEGGRKVVSVQFKTDHAQWSRQFSGQTLQAATIRLQNKMARTPQRAPHCGMQECCNLAHCPNRQSKNADVEIFRIYAPAFSLTSPL